MIVVTGGSGSGKSAYAEQRIQEFGQIPRYYLATMENRDEESQKRVDRHRAMRADKHFRTVECPYDLQNVQLEKPGAVLLECMSNLVANELFVKDGMAHMEQTAGKILNGVSRLKEQCAHLVIVTNEVFSDGLLYDEWTKNYIKCLGIVNQHLSQMADQVVEVVYTIPVMQKRGTNESDL